MQELDDLIEAKQRAEHTGQHAQSVRGVDGRVVVRAPGVGVDLVVLRNLHQRQPR